MAPKKPTRPGARHHSGRRARASHAPDLAEKDFPGERIAKVIARAGLGSRREIEDWIAAGRVAVNGEVIDSPALNVTSRDRVSVDGEPLPEPERTRLFLYHKPKGLMTTERDPEGRPTVFESLPRWMPRVMSVGRLDFNTEGLLLLTNDGGLKRVLELPATGWMRRYRARAYGEVTVEQLDALAGGLSVEGVDYGPIDAKFERATGDNVWLAIGIREGKNREVKNILGHLGLEVNRLIRVSYGPFQLSELEEGQVEEVPLRLLKDQLGPRLATEAGVDFEGPVNATPEGRPRPRPRPEARPRPSSEAPDPRRATAKAERFARLQAGATDATPMDVTAMDDDAPDVEIDAETGKIKLKPKTVSDRKGRSVAVEKRFDPAKAEARKRRPRVFAEDGSELRPRARPERRDEDERPRKPRRDGAGDGYQRSDRSGEPRKHAFRDRPAPPSGEDRPRRPYRSRDEEGPRSRGYDPIDRDRPAREDAPRRPYRPRAERAEGSEERPRRPYRPRTDRSDDERPNRPYRPREETDERPVRHGRPREDRGPGEGPRRPYRPREERAESADRPQRSFRPRRERSEGDNERPYRPHRPREERSDRGDRPQRSFRPREDRSDAQGPRRPYRPRAERTEGSEEGPRRPYRPRTERSDDERPNRAFRPRPEGADRPRGPRRDGPGGPRPKGPPRGPRSGPRSGPRRRDD